MLPVRRAHQHLARLLVRIQVRQAHLHLARLLVRQAALIHRHPVQACRAVLINHLATRRLATRRQAINPPVTQAAQIHHPVIHPAQDLGPVVLSMIANVALNVP